MKIVIGEEEETEAPLRVWLERYSEGEVILKARRGDGACVNILSLREGGIYRCSSASHLLGLAGDDEERVALVK